MLTVIIVVLTFLWIVNMLGLGGGFFLHRALFSLNHHAITLENLLVFLLLAWLLNILPSPFRQVVAVFLLLWLLSVAGFIVIVGLSNLLILLLIVGLLFYLFGWI